MTQFVNDQLVLISGESGTGKSLSLMNLRNSEKVMYLNCESGKRLPFRNKFKTYVITDPLQVYEAFTHANGNPDFDVIVIDTLTFLMDMYESNYIIPVGDKQKAWGDYQQYFKNLMQLYVAPSNKQVLFLAHTKSELNTSINEYTVSVPVKGALKANGLEAYFSTVVSTKKLPLKDVKAYGSDLINISERDETLGFKHVFQTQLTKATVGDRIRSPLNMFTVPQTYMDNDAQLLLDHLNNYYS